MKLIGFLLIALMGSNEWQAREFATEVFDYGCSQQLFPYEVELKAFLHQDLEIEHRARQVLIKYYDVDNCGKIDINCRHVIVKFNLNNDELYEFVTNMEKQGWKYQGLSIDDNMIKYQFTRKNP